MYVLIHPDKNTNMSVYGNDVFFKWLVVSDFAFHTILLILHLAGVGNLYMHNIFLQIVNNICSSQPIQYHQLDASLNTIHRAPYGDSSIVCTV